MAASAQHRARGVLRRGALVGVLFMAGVVSGWGRPPAVAAQATPTAAELQQLQQLSPEQRLQMLQRLRTQLPETASADESDSASAPTRVEIDDRMAPRFLDSEEEAPPVGAVPAVTTAEGDSTVLERFGARFFELSPKTFEPRSYGPVPDDYRLAPGDELVVEVWGEVSFRDRYTIDREGNVLLRDAGRVNVAGQTLDAAEQEIIRRFSRVLSGVRPDGGGSTMVDVGLGRLRAIRVFVIGEARRPGGYELSSAATAFQALYAAGGPNAIGSLREIQLVRGNRILSRLDLYAYLTEGRREGDLVLQDGDTLFIPVARRTVGIEGEIRRPALYELLDGEGLRELVEYAGGLRAGARTDQVHVRRILPPSAEPVGGVRRVDLDLPLDALFDPGVPSPALFDQDRVRVLAVNPREEFFVKIGGSVVSPGRYGYREGMRVSELLERAGGLWRDAVADRALLVRVRDDYTREALPLDLSRLRAGSAGDLALVPMDSLHVFSRRELADERSVSIRGDVREPGDFPFFEGTTLRDLVLAAGGTLESADTRVAEVSRLDPSDPRGDEQGARLARKIEVPLGEDGSAPEAAAFVLQNHDQVFVRRLPSWETQRNIVIEGEVLFPGTYAMLDRDERLSSLIARAGGLLPTAYAPGFRLQRTKNGAGNVGLDLRDALQHPGGPNDIVLAAGDRISIPSLPGSVKVVGQVGFPTSVVWQEGRSISDYVELAGGYAADADEGRTKVIYPNGTSKKVRKWWRDPGVLPGSTVYVPQRAPDSGVDWGQVVVSTTQVLASLATIVLVIDRTGN